MVNKMKVYCASFSGHYLGGDALIIAETKRKAFNMLKKEVDKQRIGKDLKLSDLWEVDVTKPDCTIINNGDY